VLCTFFINLKCQIININPFATNLPSDLHLYHHIQHYHHWNIQINALATEQQMTYKLDVGKAF